MSILLLSVPAHAGRAPSVGVASFYGWRENGRLMADGHRFRALGSAAAHWTLPFGTCVRVTNLRNHRHALVTIEDRGPGAPGRLIDLSLGTARRLRMEQDGLAPVALRVVFYGARRNRHRRCS